MGNILTQKRNGGAASPTALDELTYNYHTTTDGLVSNRLYQVNDVVSAGNYSDDIDDQGTFNNTHSTIETANNYGYDELGNLVRDAQEEIASIEWTVYGKMKKITRTGASSKADLEFGYDASGNRLWKKVTPKGSGAVISTYYYLRDAQGNEMCRYVKYTNTSSQLMYVAQEHSIYGSSRVGVDNRKDTLYKAGNYSPSWGGISTSRRDLGSKSFELANHLGNVLVTVSDKPIYKVSSATIFFQPEVTSISDYYPFGAPIHGRGYSSDTYRFGYNTQEKDDEIAGPGNHNTATFWEYDGRLGRRWNLDPVVNPSILPYAVFNNNPIIFFDFNGRRPLPVQDKVYKNYAWRIESGFGIRKAGWHRGVDINSGSGYYDYGATVVTTHDGIISQVHETSDGGGGRYITVQSANGKFQTKYLHLSKSLVSVGNPITEGQPIGEIGASAFNSEKGTASHLHYDIEVLKNGVFVKIDPLLEIDQNANTNNNIENLIDPQLWINGNVKVGTRDEIPQAIELTGVKVRPELLLIEPRPITQIENPTYNPENIKPIALPFSGNDSKKRKK